jgi:alpha-tubulin suppressor-like RCC1 family protein
MGHVVAKSKLGYVYTWGDNCYQQVTNKRSKFLTTPEALEGEEGRIKVLQAVAGMRTTFLLTDNMKIVAFGISSTINSQKSVYNVPL